MKVYIAAPFPYRNEAIQIKLLLEQHGHIVTSRWLVEDDALCDQDARKDLEDIRNAEVLVAVNPPEWKNSGSGGRHIEFGYAYAMGVTIILAGERTSIFHYLDDVTVLNDHTREAIVKALANDSSINTTAD